MYRNAQKEMESKNQFQLGQKPKRFTRGKCSCCEEVFHSIDDRRRAIQCLQCKNLICELCKREQGGSVSCILCIKK